MKKPVIAVIGLGATGLGAASLVWLGVLPSPFDPSKGAIAACVEATQEQLKSPSSFKLVWSDYTAREPLTWEERLPPQPDHCAISASGQGDFTNAYMCHSKRLEPRVREKMRKGLPMDGEDEIGLAEALMAADSNKKAWEARRAKNLPEDQTAFVTVEYDADNTFGATIRGFAMCRFGGIGSDGRFEKSEIDQAGPVDDESGRQAKALAEQVAGQ